MKRKHRSSVDSTEDCAGRNTMWTARLHDLFRLHTTCSKAACQFSSWMPAATNDQSDGRVLHVFPRAPYANAELNQLDHSLFSTQFLQTKRLGTSINTQELAAFSWWVDLESHRFKEQRLKKQADIRARWQRALLAQDSIQEWSVQHLEPESLFIPNIGALSCHDTEVQQRMQQMARVIESEVLQLTAPAPGACECVQDQPIHWQRDLPWPISGFGTDAVQFYAKSGLTATLLHDELAWSSAINYMSQQSRGVALWIGVSLHELSAHYSKEQIKALLTEQQVPKLLDELHALRKQLPSLTYTWQHPGDIITSPAAQGAAHVVITIGTLVEQLAWNVSTTVGGIQRCVEFWDAVGAVHYNSGLATLNVIPAARMQHLHRDWDLGRGTREIVSSLEQHRTRQAITDSLAKPYEFCDQCTRQCHFVKDVTSGQCERCIAKDRK